MRSPKATKAAKTRAKNARARAIKAKARAEVEISENAMLEARSKAYHAMEPSAICRMRQRWRWKFPTFPSCSCSRSASLTTWLSGSRPTITRRDSYRSDLQIALDLYKSYPGRQRSHVRRPVP
jgi:hypothetical protein